MIKGFDWPIYNNKKKQPVILKQFSLGGGRQFEKSDKFPRLPKNHCKKKILKYF